MIDIRSKIGEIKPSFLMRKKDKLIFYLSGLKKRKKLKS